MSNSKNKNTESSISGNQADVIRIAITGDVDTDRGILARLFGESVNIVTKDGDVVSGQVMHYFSPEDNNTNRASIYVTQKDIGNVVEVYQNEIMYVDIMTDDPSWQYFTS